MTDALISYIQWLTNTVKFFLRNLNEATITYSRLAVTFRTILLFVPDRSNVDLIQQ